MSDLGWRTSFSLLPVAVQMEIDSVCHAFEQEWQSGDRPEIRSFLPSPEDPARSALFCELLLVDVEYRKKQGDEIELQDYLREFPGDSLIVKELLARYNSQSEQIKEGKTCDDRFFVTDFHAKGGLGQISRAIDRQFNREVAVKEILGFHANDQESRLRFELEAKVTGLLEHPGIVPIYGMGRKRDGRPYYAMRMIQGGSLADTLQDQFKNGQSRLSDFELRRLLTRFVNVCQTVEYAHSRGVIHRDIKPANIMLGPYGETMLVDWGLARLVGEGEFQVKMPDSFAVDDCQTRSVIGTPSYMSPEQAAVDGAIVGPAADIYGLGATLYVLLAGQAPFQGADVSQVLEQVRQGKFPKPREIQPGVPLALQAICLKAMAPKPDDRYHGAALLGEDIERWLADEAVSAYRDPVLTRINRWAQRHRSWVAGGVALLLATVIGLAIGTVLLDTARQRIDQQRENTLTNLRISRSAVNDLLTRVSEEELFDRPGLQPLRKQLLERALIYCREFESSVEDNPVLRSELSEEIAANVQHFAEISFEVNSLEETLAVCQRSVALHESLVNEAPQSLDRQSALADAYDLLAKTQILSKSLQDARSSLDNAQVIRVRLVSASNVPDEQNRLAATMGQLAYVQWFSDPSGALESYRQAKTIREKLVADYPDREDYEFDLTLILNNIGSLERETGQPSEGIRTLKRTRDIQKRLLEGNSKSLRMRTALGKTMANLGTTFVALGQTPQAEEAFKSAEEVFQELNQESPSVTEYGVLASKLLGRRAQLMAEDGKTDEALVLYRLGKERLSDLLTVNESDWETQNAHANFANNIGMLLQELKRHSEAEKVFQEAIEPIKTRLGIDSTNIYDRELLVSLLSGLASSYDALGKTKEASEALDSSLEHQRTVVSQSATPARELALSNMMWEAGIRYRAMGKHEESAGLADERLTRWSSDPNELFYAAVEFAACAIAADSTDSLKGKPADVEFDYARRALSSLELAVQAGFNDRNQLLNTREFDILRNEKLFEQLLEQISSSK